MSWSQGRWEELIIHVDVVTGGIVGGWRADNWSYCGGIGFSIQGYRGRVDNSTAIGQGTVVSPELSFGNLLCLDAINLTLAGYHLIDIDAQNTDDEDRHDNRHHQNGNQYEA